MAMPLTEVYQRYKPCLVQITVRKPNGDLDNGAGFHVGRGFIVTARHVVEGMELVEVAGHHHAHSPISVSRAVYPDDPNIDLAVLETDFSLEHYMTEVTIMVGDTERDKTDYIPLGGHLDDWLGDELVLSKAVLLGFPAIPRANAVVLVAVEVVVNAIIDRYDGPHPHFIISAIPRGGFSGGPVFSEYGFLLGVMTHSLYAAAKPYELGFAAVLSIEPLLALLQEKDIRCGPNREFIDRLFAGDLDEIE